MRDGDRRSRREGHGGGERERDDVDIVHFQSSSARASCHKFGCGGDCGCELHKVCMHVKSLLVLREDQNDVLFPLIPL